MNDCPNTDENTHICNDCPDTSDTCKEEIGSEPNDSKTIVNALYNMLTTLINEFDGVEKLAGHLSYVNIVVHSINILADDDIIDVENSQYLIDHFIQRPKEFYDFFITLIYNSYCECEDVPTNECEDIPTSEFE